MDCAELSCSSTPAALTAFPELCYNLMHPDNAAFQGCIPKLKGASFMKTLQDILQKDSLMVIGLMSGTSADGMDAALTEITGRSTAMQVRQIAFVSLPYPEAVRNEILRLASGKQGGSHDLALFHFYLGHQAADACREVCRKAGISLAEVDLVGSHGQTLWHIPVGEDYLGMKLKATLQLGEPSVIAEALGCPVVSDFRVRDMAAGGLGAPLVPYTEYLLYRREDRCVGLQNIGGIGNLTIIPRGADLKDVSAFNTGPGNMVIDQLTEIVTEGKQHYDADGKLALAGQVSSALLSWMMEDPYLSALPPKTTGREAYGDAYISRFLSTAREMNVSAPDMIATATAFTAETIRYAMDHFCHPRPEELIVGGGGCRNPALMSMLRKRLDLPVLRNEDLGYDSDAKEAVAFAMLAAECIHGVCNNVPAVTGAAHPVVMGKISI